MQTINSSLKDKVLQYQKTGQGLEEIIIMLSPGIYSFPRNKIGFQEDDCGEFFIFFYPRLIRMVKNFHDQGKPFEWYLNSILHWQFKSFCAQKLKRERSWGISANQDFWELPDSPGCSENRELEPLDPQMAAVLGIDCCGRIKRNSDRKRFLFWVLKYVRLLDGQDIDRLSGLTGYDRGWLMGIIDELKARLHQREKRLRCLRAKQNKAFYRSRIIEEELLFEVDREKRAALSARLERLKQTGHLAQAKVARIPLAPSNRDIGEVLDIPKGTIDTSLYWLKKKLSMLYAYKSGNERQYT
ncbi:hypothetical protein ES703_13196 [subsurface metagenome]